MNYTDSNDCGGSDIERINAVVEDHRIHYMFSNLIHIRKMFGRCSGKFGKEGVFSELPR